MQRNQINFPCRSFHPADQSYRLGSPISLRGCPGVKASSRVIPTWVISRRVKLKLCTRRMEDHELQRNKSGSAQHLSLIPKAFPCTISPPHPPPLPQESRLRQSYRPGFLRRGACAGSVWCVRRLHRQVGSGLSGCCSALFPADRRRH